MPGLARPRADPGIYARGRGWSAAPVSTLAGALVCGSGRPGVAHAMGEVEVAAVPGAVCDGLGVPGAGRSTRARPGRLNFFLLARPWVPPSKARETLPMEYLVTMTTHVPAGTPEQALPDLRAREAACASELAPQGTSCGRGVRRCSWARAGEGTGRAGHRSLRPSARPAGPAVPGRPARRAARGGSRCPAW